MDRASQHSHYLGQTSRALLMLASLLVGGCVSIESGFLDGPVPEVDGGGTGGTGGSGMDGSTADQDSGPDSGDSGGGGSCEPASESCNGVDDDCDGTDDSRDPDTQAACEGEVKNASTFCGEVRGEWVCVNESCNDGFANCDGDPSNGCEPACDCQTCDDAGMDASF